MTRLSIFLLVLFLTLAGSGCNDSEKAVERAVDGLAALICTDPIFEDSRFSGKHVKKLVADSKRAETIESDRAELLPKLNSALAGKGVSQADLAALTKAIEDDPHKVVNAIFASVNNRCPEKVRDHNEDVQYAIAALTALYADPKQIR